MKLACWAVVVFLCALTLVGAKQFVRWSLIQSSEGRAEGDDVTRVGAKRFVRSSPPQSSEGRAGDVGVTLVGAKELVRSSLPQSSEGRAENVGVTLVGAKQLVRSSLPQGSVRSPLPQSSEGRAEDVGVTLKGAKQRVRSSLSQSSEGRAEDVGVTLVGAKQLVRSSLPQSSEGRAENVGVTLVGSKQLVRSSVPQSSEGRAEDVGVGTKQRIRKMLTRKKVTADDAVRSLPEGVLLATDPEQGLCTTTVTDIGPFRWARADASVDECKKACREKFSGADCIAVNFSEEYGCYLVMRSRQGGLATGTYNKEETGAGAFHCYRDVSEASPPAAEAPYG